MFSLIFNRPSLPFEKLFIITTIIFTNVYVKLLTIISTVMPSFVAYRLHLQLQCILDFYLAT